ncbi:MAG: hypothetical protein NVS9B14_20120 [Candidatus Acidiferrum sp.]
MVRLWQEAESQLCGSVTGTVVGEQGANTILKLYDEFAVRLRGFAQTLS